MSQDQPSVLPPPSAPESYGQPAKDPGKIMGILSIIFPFIFLGLVGLILGIIGRVQSKKAGFKNTPALIGIILSIIAIIGTVIMIIFGIVSAQALLQTCADLGPGVQEQGGVQFTCS